MIKHYADYSAEDFAADELFVRWVQNPHDEEVENFWQTWTRNNPYKVRQVNLARQLVEELCRFKARDLAPNETASLWKRIQASIRELPDVETLDPKTTHFHFWRRASVVAACAFFIGWIFLAIPAQDEFLVVTTQVGSPKRIVLSDGSVVQLNGKSSVRYAREWSLQKDRDVWLAGNGYFDVHPTHANAQFKIHLNGVVLRTEGTSLNISQDQNRLRVELSSGFLTLKTANKPNSIPMKSGDILELDLKNNTIVRNYNYLVAN